MALLRRSTHPDFSDHLVHFTDRVNGHSFLPTDIYAMSASQRLESILQQQKIRSSRPFNTAAPVVCFSEATSAGLDHLIGTVGYRPWGIVFDRQLIYDRGGGPVLHLRSEHWGEIASLPAPTRARFVRFAAGESDWLWEREWRVVYEDDHGFEFDIKDVQALIVGDRSWPPDEVDPMYELLGNDIAQMAAGPPPWLPDCEVWWWSRRRNRLIVV